MRKILITDQVDESCITIFKSAGYSVDYFTNLSSQDLFNKIADYDALIVRSATQVSPEVINNAGKLKVIGRAGAGVDNINVTTATRRGILVMNTPGGNTISAAEHTMALLLATSRRIPQASSSLREGLWDRKSFKGIELSGKTLGVVGLGKIGKEVAIRAKAFGMKVIAFDPVISADSISDLYVHLVKLEDIWKESDFISVHTPLNEKTKHLISLKEFRKCKKGVCIINCARGGIIGEADLLKALDEGIVSCAGLDVFETEPPDLSSKLFSHQSVVCTPHLGASTEEAQIKVAIQIAEQVIDYFEKGSLSGAVNASAIGEGIPEKLNPFMNLSQVIGKILAQVRRDTLVKIGINISGELLYNSSKLISTALLTGFLSEELEDPVNLINTPLIVEEMGIAIEETISTEHKNYFNLITAFVKTETEDWQLSGTVFGNNDLRIVEVNNFPVEFKPEGNILIYKNLDKPGMLASVTNVLSSTNINIANLALGRRAEGDFALTVVNLDSQLSEDVSERISSIEGIEDIYTVCI